MPSFRGLERQHPGRRTSANRLLVGWVIAIAFPVAAAAAAPVMAEGAQADDANSPRPQDPAAYQSPLAGYRKFQPQPVEDWPRINQTVGEVGGWRTYGMEIYRDRQRRESGEQ